MCFFFFYCRVFCCADPKKIFPGQDANAKVAQVQKFLAQLPCMKLPLIPATARAYDTATIEAIEKYGDSYTAARTAAKPQMVTKAVAPKATKKPALVGAAQLGNTRDWQLADRVINLKDSGTVPFGLRGTVRSPAMLCCSVLCSTMVCSALLWFLCCAVLFCSLLFCSVLLCSVLFCTVRFPFACSILLCSALGWELTHTHASRFVVRNTKQVVGFSEDDLSVEVIFDAPFLGGTALGHRCSDGRGKQLSVQVRHITQCAWHIRLRTWHTRLLC